MDLKTDVLLRNDELNIRAGIYSDPIIQHMLNCLSFYATVHDGHNNSSSVVISWKEQVTNRRSQDLPHLQFPLNIFSLTNPEVANSHVYRGQKVHKNEKG